MWKWLADGEPKGVVVIVHGAMEHHRRYGWLREKWRLDGFHVVMGDLPGQGLTTRSNRGHVDSFDEYILEVKKWLREALSYGLPVFLLGHSMGALTVIRMFQQKGVLPDVAGLILSSPCLGLAEYPPMPLNALSVGLNWIAPELKVDSHMDFELVTRSKTERDRMLNDSLNITKVSVRWYRELLKAMKEARERNKFMPDIPLLVMQGGDDRIVDKVRVKEWFNSLASTEKIYKEWSDCYHEIFNEPEKEWIFDYARCFVHQQLRLRKKD